MDVAPGLELFESYEGDLQQVISSVTEKISQASDESAGGGHAGGGHRAAVESRKAGLRRAEMELEEADEIVAQMELEVAGLHDKSLKARSQAKIRGYKSQLSSKRDQMKSVQSTLDRSDLLGFASDPSSAEAGGGGHNNQQAQRTRMLSATDKLNDSSRRLEDSHRIALETEDLGQGILGNLRVQRDQITGTRDRLQQADQSIDKASGTLGKMIRKMYQQRAVTYLIIAVLIFLILFVLWSKFR